jgi:phosphate transport system permease protein
LTEENGLSTDQNRSPIQNRSLTLTAADSPVVDHGPVNTPPVPRVRPAPPPAAPAAPETAEEGGRRGVKLAKISRRGDRVFSGFAGGSGVLIVALVAFVGIFLIVIAAPSLAANTADFFTSREWTVSGDTLAFGIAGLLWTTVLSAALAMVIAVPIAIGVALCITQYVPRRLSNGLAFVVDLLAAVPSIIFGLWGITVLAPLLLPAQSWLSTTLGWFPLFAAGLSSGGTVFVASIVLAIMILPIITAISRDVFDQTPHDHIEAAWALGATRWEMIRTAVLPYGRSGVVSASMLGLGRALGETIAVMIILSTPAPGAAFNPSVFAGGETFASKIANAASEFDTPAKTGAYIAAGLVLFVITFVVNAIARTIADRGVRS